MPSEYHKWLARNEKPAEKPELTKQEKRANWWHYHKVHVIVVVLVAAVTAWLVYDTQINVQPAPDFQVAYLGSKALPQATVEALETALTAQIEDINGDGLVAVCVNQYLVGMEEDGYMTLLTEQTKLMGDISACESFLFLMEDPADMQKKYEFIAYPDGTVPGEADMLSEELWLAWKDCPGLTGMLSAEEQKPLQELYVARRIIDNAKQCEYADAYAAIWETLIQAAG